MTSTIRILRAPSSTRVAIRGLSTARVIRQAGASGRSALQVLIAEGVLPAGTSEAQFAAWLLEPHEDAEDAATLAQAAADSASEAAASAQAAVDAMAGAYAIALNLTPASIPDRSYILSANDNGKLLTFTADESVLVYVDADLPAGCAAGICKAGAGDVQVVRGTTSVQAPADKLVLTTRYAYAVVRRISADLHILHGAEATLSPDLVIDRALFDQVAASGLAGLLLT